MIPPYLYHYTSLDTLELILKNKTFRFTRLDLMNDPVEGNLERFTEARKNIFSSSWTSDREESLPMWKMYGDIKGVRLRMPIDLFDFSGNMLLTKIDGRYLIKSLLDSNYTIDIGEIVFAANSPKKTYPMLKTVIGPVKVEYVDTIEQLSEDIIRKDVNKSKDFDMFTIGMTLLGEKKLRTWSYEKEYRYRVTVGDMIMMAGSEQILNSPRGVVSRNVDIKFDESKLHGVEVLLAPHTPVDAKEKLESLMKEIGVNNYIINRSKIEIR